MESAGFTDKDYLCAPLRGIEKPLIHQVIIDDNIGLADAPKTLDGDEPWVARTRPYEIDLSFGHLYRLLF